MDVLEAVQAAMRRITAGDTERLGPDEVIARLGPDVPVTVVDSSSPDGPGADVVEARQLQDRHGQQWVGVCGHYVVVSSEGEPVWSLVNIEDADGTSSTR